MKQNKYLRKIIIAGVLLIAGVFIYFNFAEIVFSGGIHGYPVADESEKISVLFFEINKYQQEFFIKNNRYGSWEELGQEYFTPQTRQMIDSFKIFKIALWADKKSFQCVASAPRVVFKVDETGVLKRRMDFVGRGSITTCFYPGLQTKYYDLGNPNEIDKTNFRDFSPKTK